VLKREVDYRYIASGAVRRLALTLVPLADDICTSVDVAAKRIVIDPPDGLLELNARGTRRAAGR